MANRYAVANGESTSWWFAFTPLHLVWAGTEAVLVFFVLSGFVLSAGFLRAPSAGRWSACCASRLVRLYLPVWASLALAVVLVLLFPRQATPGVSWWFAAHAVEPGVGQSLGDAALLGGVSWVHKSLWSLQYEVLFSLALPLHVFLATRRLPWWALGVSSLVLVAVGQVLVWDALSWLAVVGVGVSLTSGRARIMMRIPRWNSGARPGTTWAGLTVVAVVPVRGPDTVLDLVRPVPQVPAPIRARAIEVAG